MSCWPCESFKILQSASYTDHLSSHCWAMKRSSTSISQPHWYYLAWDGLKAYQWQAAFTLPFCLSFIFLFHKSHRWDWKASQFWLVKKSKVLLSAECAGNCPITPSFHSQCHQYTCTRYASQIKTFTYIYVHLYIAYLYAFWAMWK